MDTMFLLTEGYGIWYNMGVRGQIRALCEYLLSITYKFNIFVDN
jgi:hypothetical protein